MPDPQMKLPPGATLVSDGPAMKLPPGATLVTAPQTLDPSQPGMQPSADHIDPAKSIGDFAKEWWDQVNPVTGITGMRDLVNHPIATGGAMLDTQAAILDKAKEAFKNGRPVEGVRHALNYLIPVLGPQIDRAGDLADQGQLAKSAGATTGIATNIATPELVKGVKVPASLAARSDTVARDLYQGALKPPVNSPNVAAIVQTGLENRIPVSAAGVEKLNSLVADLNTKIGAEIAAKPGVTVNKFKVASRLGDTAQDLSNQVNPSKDLKAVAESGNEFLGTQPGRIPASQAQALKVGTYKQLAGKYGELGNAAIESQKALARGLKEELANAFPELKALNASEGNLLDLQPALERAVNRNGNNQIVGIGTPAVTGAAKVVTGSAPVAAAAGIMKAIVDAPMVKSRIAEAIYWGSKKTANPLTMAAAKAKVAAYSNALGNSVANQGTSQTGTEPQQ